MKDAGEMGGMQSRQDDTQGGRSNAKKVSAGRAARGTRGAEHRNKYLRGEKRAG